MIASGFVLVLLTTVLQFIVFQYGKGSVRAALDEAARSAARAGGNVEVCESRAANVLDDLLGGEMGEGVSITCSDAGDRVVVSATVHFDGWFGSLTDYTTTLTSSAAKEDK